MLPKSKETSGAPGSGWQSYQDAQQTFDRIVPGKTTAAELAGMKLDPRANPNITILPRYEVMSRFIVNQTVTVNDLDEGVRLCIEARENCRALEVNQTASQKKRVGNAALDMAKMYRETQTTGWRFTGLILIKDGVVVYKLTGGMPSSHEVAANQDNLAPLQSLSSKLNALNNIDTPSLLSKASSVSGRFTRDMLGPEGWDRFMERARAVFAERFPERINDFRDVNLAVGTKASDGLAQQDVQGARR